MNKFITEVIKEIKIFYDGIGSIHCPVLKTDIVFNRYGWNHILYKGNGHRRGEKDIRNRLRIFKDVPDVIKCCKWFSPPRTMTNKVGVNERNAEYCELYHTFKYWFKTEHVTVVIRKFDNSEYHYYSLRSDVEWLKSKKAL
ncbi:hypothetical protein A3K01_01595 [candidate division WWE3 bacterium RIFOXYD1_FULL_43_17]|uniref:Uncharacterized protein n=3 Tax=Katanobacteria TaxID=422282 RepID=A0A1F4XFS3_UNCKA|nr:MAG: hypothetical protein UU59_C0012G0007 [candidate division WWE3 bacterium GW2011_GWE1_41_27]KKS59252.1 MAG: hypothetical protein UV26_C0026G0007 [candidate division WWE3 bacterium GW2011_GWF2_42_42]OGC80511.1 MAG: hypothetical protein A3K01_01595 [candidate division WWE3 bacterium RIFOXYD1_FULL_43_17]